MYDAGHCYLKRERLQELLEQCPPGSTIWTMPTGNLSIMDASGRYVGYIDLAWNEDIVWADQPIDPNEQVTQLF